MMSDSGPSLATKKHNCNMGNTAIAPQRHAQRGCPFDGTANGLAVEMAARSLPHLAGEFS